MERYKDLTGVTFLRKASTPFLQEPTKPDFKTSGTGPEAELSPDEALSHVIYGAIVGGDLDPSSPVFSAARPGKGDEVTSSAADPDDVPMQLRPSAAKVLMKVLYAAHMAR